MTRRPVKRRFNGNTVSGAYSVEVSIVSVVIFSLCFGSVCTLDNKLLLFLLDGFRWDYLDTGGNYSGFSKFLSEGVKAKWSIPDFPTSSYPNYYSIMTGLHTNEHGFIGNYMYDEDHREYFLIGSNVEQFNAHWWEEAEPLWVTAESNGKKTSWYRWPGTEVTIHGVTPYQHTNYTRVTTLSDMDVDIEAALADLSEGMAVVGVYVEVLDYVGHRYGPDSDELHDSLLQMDERIGRLMDSMDARNLSSSVNIMIFSDHGMTTVQQFINITAILRTRRIERFLNNCAHVSVWPARGYLDVVYYQLRSFSSHMKVFKEPDIPERLKYRGHRRVASILLLADPGYCILTSPKAFRYVGVHGYDNEDEDMRAVFFARGPDFNKGFTAGPISIVDIYQLMNHVTGLEAHNNSGNWSAVEDMLIQKQINGYSKLTPNLSVFIPFLLLCAWLSFVCG